eukprot:m.57461 g.57461  ORF g.57461 m.57461 type:complete len:101 (-) comp12744_c0_seq1:4351-4653(-)
MTTADLAGQRKTNRDQTDRTHTNQDGVQAATSPTHTPVCFGITFEVRDLRGLSSPPTPQQQPSPFFFLVVDILTTTTAHTQAALDVPPDQLGVPSFLLDR